MPKRDYLIALACYLAIPVVVIGGGVLVSLIDPEWAHGTADYPRNFRLLQFVQMGVMAGIAALTLVLWAATCYFVLKAKQRSPLWLALAAGGSLGFPFIAMLADRAPAPDDLYQQFTGELKLVWRVLLEIVLFICAWVIAFQCVLLKGDLMVRLESARTGTPVETIIERQNASSGMYAFGEALQALYLLPLLYLLWPILFNLVGRLFGQRTTAIN